LNQEITCIICPKSCKINVFKSDSVTEATGCECARGKKYAINEISDPRRIFTSTVLVDNGPIKMLPVRTDLPIRKNDWKKASELIRDIVVTPPVSFGQTIIDGFLEEKIRFIATREI
jgi:CxxC motif-containing protein